MSAAESGIGGWEHKKTSAYSFISLHQVFYDPMEPKVLAPKEAEIAWICNDIHDSAQRVTPWRGYQEPRSEPRIDPLGITLLFQIDIFDKGE
mmetsp:Transcript_15664/g.23025  ORF Transcript_15664/g.23025 Transcript_15664/m.23025 type:complete len:92 (+) Transcript_15664:364-639(+)